MPTIQQTTIAPYTPQQMFDLVNDIEQYPHFLPGCPRATLEWQTPQSLQATLYFAKGLIEQAFTTVNHFTAPHRINMCLVKGPFTFLEGHWQFEAVPEGTQISFHLSFEWRYGWLSTAIGPFFKQMIEGLIGAFVRRAQTVYIADKLQQPASMAIEVAYASPTAQRSIALQVPLGTTLHQAIVLSGIQDDFPTMDIAQQCVGVFGKIKSLEDTVEPGDRVEIYRPLQCDPMLARKERVKQNKKRTNPDPPQEAHRA